MTAGPLTQPGGDSRGVQISLIDLSGDTAVLRLAGELDFGNAELLPAMLEDEVIPARRIVLDVSGLAFCDCAGLRAILACRDLVTDAGGSFVLSGVTHALARLLTITKLGGELTVETLEEPAV